MNKQFLMLAAGLVILPGLAYSQADISSSASDLAVSDGRMIDEDGRCRTPVGNTVETDKGLR